MRDGALQRIVPALDRRALLLCEPEPDRVDMAARRVLGRRRIATGDRFHEVGMLLDEDSRVGETVFETLLVKGLEPRPDDLPDFVQERHGDGRDHRGVQLSGIASSSPVSVFRVLQNDSIAALP